MTQEAKRELGRSALAIAFVIGLLALVFLLPSACGGPEIVDNGQISAHEFLEAAPGVTRKELGEACNTYGRDGCKSDLCMNTKHDPGTGWICSETCQSTHECPVDWKCRQIYPTRTGSFCIPPEDWVAQVAVSRTAGGQL